jgi:cytochrome c biogenesis protein CcmG, thiol:disulfide interchange protein DsbE
MSDRTQWWIVGGVLAVLTGLLVAGWSVRHQFLPVEVGTRAPNVVAHDMDGNQVELADLRGEVVLLNVWATWCPPCREEMPSMQRLHERLGPKGLHIIAVSIDAEPGRREPGVRPGGNVRAFVEGMELDFGIWLDPAGDIQRVYRTRGVPESFVIDRDGTIVRKVPGAIEWDSEPNVEMLTMLLER